jgi:hypothetical protein
MENKLYHFFPKKFESAEKIVSIVKSILENGLYLSREILRVSWQDMHAVGGLQRKLEAEQFRFCLTAITNKIELITHADRFGFVGLEFDMDFIIKMGGFPIFYVPTPKCENAGIEEYKGVSLLYRLADAQQIFEYIITNDVIQSEDIDLENVLGAIKFLANICYPTQRMPNSGSVDVNYYNQREWRIIHNLTSENVRIGYHSNNHAIQAFDDVPIRNFITRIILFKNQNISEGTCDYIYNGINELMIHFEMNCRLDRNESKSC